MLTPVKPQLETNFMGPQGVGLGPDASRVSGDLQGEPAGTELDRPDSPVPDEWIPALVPCILRWTQDAPATARG